MQYLCKQAHLQLPMSTAQKRRRDSEPACPLAPESLPAGPADFEGFANFALDAARVLVQDDQRRQRMAMHLRKVIVTDSVFTGMAAFEDTVRLYLNAVADVMEVPRPKIHHHSGCDIELDSQKVLAGRQCEQGPMKVFHSAEGRLPENARKRMQRLLPKVGATEAESREAHSRLYTFMLTKGKMCFPQDATDEDICTGKATNVRWLQKESQAKTFLLLAQGSTPCVAFSGRASKRPKGMADSTMSASHIWFAEQDAVLAQPVPCIGFHENLKNFPWLQFIGPMQNVTEQRRLVVCPSSVGYPARRERGLGAIMGSKMTYMGAAPHEEEFARLFFRRLTADASVFMVDSDEHVQETICCA